MRPRVAAPPLYPSAPHHVPWGSAPPEETGPRRSLVLSGGGIRLSYQAGVLRAIDEAGLRFAHMDATSGGALNLGMILSGLHPREMCERWRTLNVFDTVSVMPLEKYLKSSDCLAMGSAAGFYERVFPHLGIDAAKIRAARGIRGTFNVLDFSRKVPEVIQHTTIDAEMLVAGMSLPGVMPPVRRGDSLYLDCAFVTDANILEAVRQGAEEIWLVWCLGNLPEYLGGPLRLYVQMLEMAANCSLNQEMEEIARINRRIMAGEPVGGRTRPIVLHIVRPEFPLPLDPELYVGHVTAATLIEMGYADARRYLSRMEPSGVPLRPETIMMSTPSSPGITFDEVMKGGFALAETDPREGSARGKVDGTELTMHATVTVRDVDRFLADPGHEGTLVGTLDFPPFGSAIPCGQGVFNLFSPGDDPEMKLMVYELPFEHGGESYYLAGRKEVKDDPGFDLWADTTTLLTRLHRGRDGTGEVVGAGVLSLGAADFAKVLTRLRVIDTDDPGQKAATIGKFGKFFAGQLWNSYAAIAR